MEETEERINKLDNITKPPNLNNREKFDQKHKWIQSQKILKLLQKI